MTDESPPHDKAPAEQAAELQSGPTPTPAPEPEPHERADSIAPMSAPIVSLDEDARSDSNSTLGVDVEAPFARRLSPPPKPRSIPPTAEQQPPLASPGFVSPLAGSLRPSRNDGTLAGQSAPKPVADPAAERRHNLGVSASSVGAVRSSMGSLPPTAVFPKVSTRPPPTLPAGTSPSQYPWAVPATPDTVIMRPRTGAVGRPFEHVRAAGTSNPTSSRAPVLPPARRSGEGTPFSLRTEASESAARNSSGQVPAPQEPGQPALPPARRSDGLPPMEEPGETAAARGPALPRALRDSAPPGTGRGASKSRFVPQQLRKDTPAVAIQAMRIIAIGSDDGPVSLPARAPNTSGDLPELTAAAPPPAIDPVPTQPAAMREAALDEPANALPPALPDAALQEVPPLPEEALEEVPAAEGLTRQAEPLNELELYQLTGQPPDAAVAEPIPDGEVAAIDSQRFAATATADESGASVRKRPPPPKRVSVPSASGESTSEGRIAAAVATTSDRPMPPRPVAVAPTEVAPRQPPPAPSRVPRDPALRQATKPEALERPESVSRKPDPPERKSEPDTAGSEEKPKARAPAARRLWWDELFGEDFSRANPRLTEAQIDQEATFIEESLGMAPGAVVLDLGCGAGYHAVELASRGYGIVGYDLSLHQLSLAQEVAHEHGQKLNFMQGDMRDMAFEEVFDSIYCWNTTFGYYEEEKNVQVAQRIFAALKPGGTVLLDVANRDFVVMNQPSSVWYEGDSCVCMDDMSVDFFTSRLRVKRSLILDDGRTRECHYSIRLYSLHELGRILHDIGFRVTEASGHPSMPGVFLGQSSPRILILAQRP